MKNAEKSKRQAALANLLAVIETWINTESGPHMKYSHPELKLQVTLRGYKKIILERKFEEVTRGRERRWDTT